MNSETVPAPRWLSRPDSMLLVVPSHVVAMQNLRPRTRLRGTLLLENTSASEDLVFKILTTAPKGFLVARPRRGVIQPKQRVQVTLTAAESSLVRGSHPSLYKIKIQSFAVNAGATVDLNAVFQQITWKRVNVQILTCEYHDATSEETNNWQPKKLGKVTWRDQNGKDAALGWAAGTQHSQKSSDSESQVALTDWGFGNEQNAVTGEQDGWDYGNEKETGADGQQEWGADGQQEWGAGGQQEWGAGGSQEWGAAGSQDWGAEDQKDWQPGEQPVWDADDHHLDRIDQGPEYVEDPGFFQTKSLGITNLLLTFTYALLLGIVIGKCFM